jgi:hypothetical protein
VSIFDKFAHPDIDPDDLKSAINARIQQSVADSKRAARNPQTAQEVEQDLFVALLASSPIKDWPDWLCEYAIDYAASVADGAQFFIQLGKALKKAGRSRWFDRLDMRILTNWRKGHNLRSKTRAEGVEFLRAAGLLSASHCYQSDDDSRDRKIKDKRATTVYASRLKRLGLTRQQPH